MIERVLEKDGCSIHYWLSENPGKEWLVFTHGMLMDHSQFGEQVDFLKKDYQILSWDVRGHGKSGPMGDGFSIRGAAEDLLAILDEINCSTATLVGLSMGGIISQEVAFLGPGRVGRLVVIGSLCNTWRQPRVAKLVGVVSLSMFRLFPEKFLHWFGGFCAGIKKTTRKQAARLGRQVPKADFLKIWEAITSCDHYEENYRIRQPFLLTHGRYDILVGLGLIKVLAPRWADYEPDCRYEVIPKAGHNAMNDNPDYFNQLLLDFLQTK
ncbi:MAG: alpha/beta hydrolase [Sedimentisphaerales bacterium]|nr:alpha/beta hydrolase [Sedimentisphaerales bacterium]